MVERETGGGERQGEIGVAGALRRAHHYVCDTRCRAHEIARPLHRAHDGLARTLGHCRARARRATASARSAVRAARGRRTRRGCRCPTCRRAPRDAPCRSLRCARPPIDRRATSPKAAGRAATDARQPHRRPCRARGDRPAARATPGGCACRPRCRARPPTRGARGPADCAAVDTGVTPAATCSRCDRGRRGSRRSDRWQDRARSRALQAHSAAGRGSRARAAPRQASKDDLQPRAARLRSRTRNGNHLTVRAGRAARALARRADGPGLGDSRGACLARRSRARACRRDSPPRAALRDRQPRTVAPRD